MLHDGTFFCTVPAVAHRPTRIVFIAGPAERGGVATSTRRILGSLRGAGYALEVLVPDDALFPGDVWREGDVARFGPPTLDPRTWLEACLPLARAAAPDLVLGYYASAGGWVATELAEALGVPSIVSCRGNDIDRDPSHPERGARVRQALSRASAVAAVSSEMVGEIRERFGVAATFVTNAVDTGAFYPDPEAGAALKASLELGEGPVLGLFGEFKPKRGLAALRELAGPALARFTVALFGTVRASVAEEVAPEWRRVPWLEGDALRAAYNACEVVAQPSLADGMPNVVLEAMACARTVVASARAGMLDLIEDGVTGRLCSEPDEWRLALEAPFDPRLGARARADVPTPEVELAALEALIQSVS